MANRSGICILCIGNDLVNLNLRCSRLKELGWNVIGSGNGHDGLFRFAQEPVEVVVLDLDDNGAESALIASQIKGQNASVPIIMLVEKRETLLPGATDQADAVVSKAEEEQVLAMCIRELLGNA